MSDIVIKFQQGAFIFVTHSYLHRHTHKQKSQMSILVAIDNKYHDFQVTGGHYG